MYNNGEGAMDKIYFKADSKLDIVAMGRIGIDFYPNEWNRPLEETETFTKSVGGSPANIAVGTSRYGVRTGFIGRISDDAFGRYALKYFRGKGIDTSALVVDKDGFNMSSAFVEIISPEESNVIFYRHDPVDLKLTMEDVPEDYIREAKALIISGTALAASPSREAVFSALKYARLHGTKTFLDIDYRPYTWKSMDEASLYCSMAAQLCDVIVGTREEFDVLEYIDLKDNSDDDATGRFWLQFNPELVIVKRGKDGSRAYLKDGSIFDGDVFPVKPLKTQGAGDSFLAGVASSLLKGKNVVEAMRYGAGAAAIVVQENSCADAMPTEEEIRGFIEAYEGGA